MDDHAPDPDGPGGSRPLLDDGSRPLLDDGSRPLLDGGSRPLLDGGSRPLLDGGSRPLIGAAPEPDAEALEAGRLLFASECRFFYAAQSLGQLPPPGLPELAFAGRSNVGKSSLINALTGRRALARASNTPGRTRQLNFFDLGGRLVLVDMPGYGYAQAAKDIKADWQGLMFAYLRGRPTLQRVILLLDSRIELKESDHTVMDLLDQAAVTYQLVLTKTDAVKPGALARKQAEVEALSARHPAAFPHVLATSSDTGAGIETLRAAMTGLAA